MNEENLTPQDERLTRWIDGPPEASPPDDLDAAAAEREKAAVNALATSLRQHVPTRIEPPYPDFFNSQISKRIRGEDLARRETVPGGIGGWFSWLRNPWVTGISAAAAAVAIVMSIPSHATESGTRVLSVFSPEPNATATVIPSKDGAAMIIDVEGLDAFPADRPVVGQLTDDSVSLVARNSR